MCRNIRNVTISGEETRVLEKLITNNRNPEYIAELYKLIEVTKYEKFRSKRACKPTTDYITYGFDKFEKERLVPVSQPLSIRGNKPIGCFWGSPVGAEFGWKQWCERNDFRLSSFSSYIVWRLKDGSKILKIRSAADVEPLPVVIDENLNDLPNIDYNLLRTKFDAVELVNPWIGKSCSHSSHKEFGFNTWDCQSIVVLNPNKIEVLRCRRDICKH